MSKIMELADIYAEEVDYYAKNCFQTNAKFERVSEARATLRTAVDSLEAENGFLREKLAALETSMPPVPEFLYVGSAQHLHELNDEWASKLPIGTKLYTNALTKEATK